MPLWPQLREALERYLAEHSPSRLLFPSYRHRAESVEYRVEQHVAKLGARLEVLRGVGFGTTIGTTA